MPSAHVFTKKVFTISILLYVVVFSADFIRVIA
jgi:hypothetical protein